VPPGKAEILERERRWALPVAIATFVGVVLVFAWLVILQTAIGGGTNYEGLESVNEKTFAFSLAGILNALGFTLLLAPMLYLFRAVEARGDRVRSGLVGLVIIAPLCLGIAAILLTVGTNQAATSFVNGEARATLSGSQAGRECREERQENGSKSFGEEFEATKGTTSQQVCRTQKLEEDRASRAAEDSSTLEVAQIVGLIGGLSLVVALFYTCLWAMRTGLLTRFWGALGMALGIATLIGLTPFTLIWFFYFGLLVAGWVPRGRPPAWAAGEAVPWPSPGERAAAELSGRGPEDETPGEGPEGGLGGGDEGPEPGGEGGAEPGGEGEPRRKRKQRT
jgi:hypothetical protein